MCDRHPWGEPDGVLTCLDTSGGEHTHRYQSTTVADRHDGSEGMDD